MDIVAPEDIFGTIQMYEEIPDAENVRGIQIMFVEENPYGKSNIISFVITERDTIILIDSEDDTSSYQLSYSECSICEEYNHCYTIPSLNFSYMTLKTGDISSTSKMCSECYSDIKKLSQPILEDINSSNVVSHLI